MRIATINVRGMRNRNKRRTVYRFLKQNKYNIALLQETYIAKEDVNKWCTEWGGNLYAAPHTNHSRGLVILTRGMNCNVKNIEVEDYKTRVQIVKIEVENQNYCVINLYAPNQDAEKAIFYERVAVMLKKYVDFELENVVIGGDMNTLCEPKMDNIAGENPSQRVLESFRKFRSELQLVDVWRQINPGKKEFTWKRNTPFIARRLDYLFVNNILSGKCDKAEIIPFPNSDHQLVFADLNMNICDRGPGYWKLNNSMLKDTDFVSMVNGVIEDTVNEYENKINAQILWDLCKAQIKNAAIEYCKAVSVKRKTKLIEIENRLATIYKNLAIHKNKAQLKIADDLKLQYEILAEVDAKGAQLRSKVQWVEEGERNTRFFLSLEKIHQIKKTIVSLKKEDGENVTQIEEVLNMLYEHYKNLFNQQQVFDQSLFNEFTNDIELPILNQDDVEVCEGMLSEEECGYVLSKMKNESSPGLDGLGAPFYKVFWAKIKNLVMGSINYAFEKGELSATQRKGVIVLIPKGNSQSNELKNFRPISLTCCDYKIGAAALAARIQKVISKLVDTDQTAYIKGRSISQNIRLIEDAIFYTNVNDLPGAIVALDFSKAFDSISKEFVLVILRKYNFGHDFTKWIQVFMNNAQSCVMNAGWLSDYFYLERGIRQGCPLSALMFVLAVEMLACKLRQSPDVKGIQLPGTDVELCISQYADDNTLFCRDEDSIHRAFNFINVFSLISGLYLNMNKTEGIWIGNWKYKRKIIGDIHWHTGVGSRLKILGVVFCNNDSAGNVLENWETRIDKIQKLVDVWGKRKLSMLGRVIIVKSLMLSKLTHLLSVLMMPEVLRKQVNSIVFKFVWGVSARGGERVKRDVLIQDFADGGIRMPSVEIMQKSIVLGMMNDIIQTEQRYTVIPRWFS